ncbi:MAG: sensor histidine kinase [Clostridia bacterium]
MNRKTKGSRSLLGMYIAILLVVSLVPVLILSGVAIASLRTQLLAEVDATTRSLNQAIASETRRIVENSNDHLAVYISMFDLGYDLPFIQTALDVTILSHHEIDRLLVLDEEAVLLAASSEHQGSLGTDYSGLDFFHGSPEEGDGTLFSSATLSPFSGSVTVFLGRHTANGWMVIFELNLDSLSEYLRPLRVGPSDHIAIVDQTGRFIAHTGSDFVQEQRFETRLPPGPQATAEIEDAGQHWFAYAQEIPETPWRVVYYRDAEQALSAVPGVIGAVVILAFLSMITAMTVAHRLRRVSRKIFAEYVRKTEAVAAGQYELHVDPPFIEFDGLSRSIAAMAEAVSRREGELRSAVSEREHLLREIHHRVKNNLQIVVSLLNLEMSTLPNPEQTAALTSSIERIRSMGLVHETLYGQSRLDEVDLGDYTGHLLDYLSSSYRRQGTSIERRITTTRLSLDQALPCGLILNELITNAFKYGVGDRSEARIIVSLTEEPGFLVLSVQDDGPGFRDDFNPRESSSLGVSLVRSLAEQLDGTANWTNPDTGGTLVTVRFPRA